MTFDFSAASFKRKPVKLSTIPYMHPEMRARVFAVCEDGCYCAHDGERTASLRSRAVSGNVAVYLQCDACGKSLGSALTKQQHPNWQSYPLWDSALSEDYDRKFRDHAASAVTTPDQREAEYRARAQEYEAWCRTSPEWREITKKVAWRSRGHCEACLNAPAEVVRHLTYQFGRLPPAWHLKAVCRPCHDSLHTSGHDWCDWGMAR